MEIVLFFVFAAFALLSAIVLVLHRSPMSSFAGFLGTLAATAVLFVLLAAPLVAGLQVVLYCLVSLVFYLYSSELCALKYEVACKKSPSPSRFFAAASTLVFTALLAALIGRAEGMTLPVGFSEDRSSITELSRNFLLDHLLPIALVGLLIMIAGVGIRVILRDAGARDL